MNYADFMLNNLTIGSNRNTNSYICSVTDSTNDINDSTPYITSTTDVTVTSSTTSTTIHPISSSVQINTSDATNTSGYLHSRPTIYPVIISSLAGGILVVFFIVCIVVLLLKRKLHRRHKNSDNFTLSPTDSLFNR